MVCLILYDSSYMTFWNEQNYITTENQSVPARGWGQEEGWQLHNYTHLSEFRSIH